MEDACRELIQFMQLSSRLELKLTATKNVLALTGSSEGRKFITDNHILLEAILSLTKDGNFLVAKDCYLALVNLSTEDHAVEFMLKKYSILPELLTIICDSQSQFSDHCCMIISNVTRSKSGSKQCYDVLSNINPMFMVTLLNVFCNTNYNKKNCTLDYIGSIFANLTQLTEGRDFFLETSASNILKIISFVQYENSLIRRGASASVLRNCCFDYEKHEWLLSDEINLLSHLLLPLTGPEEFEESEVEKLPIDLQYLPPEKRREQDIDVRKLLIEAMILLCATKHGREFVKSRNTYLIIRELHNWETKNNTQEMVNECEKLIQILISDEDNVDNLMTYETPEEHKKILKKILI